jgi:transcriptional regulator with XRE-family HTH domain
MEPGHARQKSLRSHYHRAVVTVIVATRRESNLTQEGLGKALEWHRSLIVKIKSGERRVDVPEFVALANGLNIDPTLLLARVLRW